MNLTLPELQELVEKFATILNRFEGYDEKNLSGYRHKLYLANGDMINFSVPINTVPHLLGIKVDYLIASGIYGNCKNTIDVVSKMCNDYYSIHSKTKEGIISYDNIFSKYVKEKTNYLLSNLYIDENETELVCKYDSKKSFENTENAQKFDYVIIKRINDKIGILCLVKKESYYVPMSNRIYNNLEEAEDFLNEILKNQIITILRGHQTTNYYTDYIKKGKLIINAKLDKIDNLKFYKNKFDSIIDITSDYEYALNSLANRKEERNFNNSFIENISKSIAEGKIIKTDEIEENNLTQIVDAFNNFLCRGSKNDANLEYSEAIKELKTLKEKIIELREENDSLNSKLYASTKLNEDLEAQNTDLKEKQDQIIKILSPKKNVE